MDDYVLNTYDIDKIISLDLEKHICIYDIVIYMHIYGFLLKRLVYNFDLSQFHKTG